MAEWGWVNQDTAINLGKAFFNPQTGQVESETNKGGVGNPYAQAPTNNYADPKWTPEQQYKYSLALSQGNNELAKQIGDASWQDYDRRRAEAGSIQRSWEAAAKGRAAAGGGNGDAGWNWDSPDYRMERQLDYDLQRAQSYGNRQTTNYQYPRLGI